jgi:excisionase family DNA binding protein
MPRTAQPTRTSRAREAPALPELMDMERAIAALATTRPTFYRWLRAGAIKGVKVGRQWRFRREDIERFLAGEGPRIEVPGDIKPLLAELRRRLGQRAAGIDGDPIDVAISLVITLAAQEKASDVHLVGFARDAALELRIDGALQAVARFDSRLLPLLIERFKRMAGMDPALRDVSQDGAMIVQLAQQRLSMRVSVLPTAHGESLVASLQDQELATPSWAQMNLAARERSLIERALSAPHGIAVFAGPAGSGKSTMLYACVGAIDDAKSRVVTVEEYMPYHLPRAVRVRVDADGGLGYPAALRAVLRCDPDIIAIGELRDRETLAAAAECSITGHLVLGCAHAADAIGALRRIADLDSEHGAALEEVFLVMAQRLVRRLCPRCAVAHAPSAALVRQAELVASAGGVRWSELKPDWRRAPGCDHCRGTGCRGRVPVIEMIEVTRDLRQALRRGASDDELRAVAVGQGMVTLAGDAVRKAAEGVVAVSELPRSIPELSGLEE